VRRSRASFVARTEIRTGIDVRNDDVERAHVLDDTHLQTPFDSSRWKKIIERPAH